MPQRKIALVFFNYKDENGRVCSAARGDVVDLPEEEAKRGDAIGAFSGQDPVASDNLTTFTNNGKQGGVHTIVAPEAVVPSELSDEQIDSLSGEALENACEMASIDTSEGGSLANGGLSADEKRAALKAANAS